jgi:hypothetical protein
MTVKLSTINRETQVFTYEGRTYETRFGYGYGNYVYFRVVDKTNAYRRGKRCTEMTFEALNETTGYEEFTDKMAMFCELMKQYEGTEKEIELREENYKLYFNSRKSIDVSPANFEHIKPLKEKPKKWTKSHVIRLLANNQFTDFVKNGKYTDDYAYDNAVNYRQGEKQSAEEMVKELIEHGDGWWFSEKEGKLSINCHHFDYNELKIAI